ncbi:MAG: OPT/YSL family transporter [Candidatus Korarchaeota archaeon]
MDKPENIGERGFSITSVVVAILLSLFLSASSTYIALFVSGLPWPIIFSAITSLALVSFANRLHNRKTLNIAEINVAHAGASIGGLVAAGVSFTIPAVILLGGQFPPLHVVILVTALATVQGVAVSVPLRRVTIDKENLPYPSGAVGAEVISISVRGGKNARILLAFGAGAAIYSCFLSIANISTFSWTITISGIVFIVGILPLLVAVSTGYLLGARLSLGSWFLGAIFGWLFLSVLFQLNGMNYNDAIVLVQRIGMGMVMGAGIGFLVTRGVKIRNVKSLSINIGDVVVMFPIVISILALPLLLICGISLIGAVFAVAGGWFASAVAGYVTGETNIDPLEQFGILVGLFMSITVFGLGIDVPTWERVIVIGYVSVTAAIAGDIGHDYRAAKILNTRVFDIVKVDLIAAIVAAVAVPLSLLIVLNAYGVILLAPNAPYALQSRLVAISLELGGAVIFPIVVGMIVGLLLETLLFIKRKDKKFEFSPLAFGVGVFIGWWLSIPVAIGGLIQVAVSRKWKRAELYGTIAAGGLMGGEGIVGFLRALVLIVTFSTYMFDIISMIIATVLLMLALKNKRM